MYINPLSETFSRLGEVEWSFWYSLMKKVIVFRIPTGSFVCGGKMLQGLVLVLLKKQEHRII